MQKKLDYFIRTLKLVLELLMSIWSICIGLFKQVGGDNGIWYLIIGISLLLAIICVLWNTNNKFVYIKRQIEEIKNANHTIYVVMRSLSPEKTNRLYKKYDEELEKAYKERGIEVKVIAPYRLTESRLEGARDIAHRNIELKFSKELATKDISFILVDGKYFICSQQKKDTKDPSRKCAEFVNEDMVEELTSYFKRLWDEARECTEYCTDCKRRLNEINVKKCEECACNN